MKGPMYVPADTNKVDTGSKYYRAAIANNKELARLRNIAKAYFSSTPTISNLWNGTNAYIKSLPVIGTIASVPDKLEKLRVLRYLLNYNKQ